MADPDNQHDSTQLAAIKNKPGVGSQLMVGAIKAVLGNIPFVGSALNEALFDIRSRIQQERVNSLVEKISEAMSELSEAAIDRDYLATEEFSDLICEVFVRAVRTRSEQKRRRFAQIVIGSVTGAKEQAFDHVFRQLVEEIDEDGIEVLSRFVPVYARSESANQPNDWQHPMSEVLDYSQATVLGRDPVQTRTIIQNLIRVGLLFDDSHGRFSSPPYTVVMPTDLGAKFYAWLKSLPEVPA